MVLGMSKRKSDLQPWTGLVKRVHNGKREVKIAVVGKYFGTGNFTLADSYISVIESIKHASWSQSVRPKLEWIDSEEFEKDPKSVKKLSEFDGVIVPGGFGTRGVEGIITAIEYVRKNHIPYLGLCYGMQLACIEFARHVLNKSGAHTVEVDSKAKHPIIHINPLQATNVREQKYGGTMRLGAYDCVLRKDTAVYKAYGKDLISERHRHRYEFNNDYREEMDKAGLQVVGINPETDLVEIVELENHPYFVGVQFHPEFKSRPMQPHPLFVGLVKAAIK